MSLVPSPGEFVEDDFGTDRELVAIYCVFYTPLESKRAHWEKMRREPERGGSVANGRIKRLAIMHLGIILLRWKRAALRRT
jgi:hypothetical protein